MVGTVLTTPRRHGRMQGKEKPQHVHMTVLRAENRPDDRRADAGQAFAGLAVAQDLIIRRSATGFAGNLLPGVTLLIHFGLGQTE